MAQSSPGAAYAGSYKGRASTTSGGLCVDFSATMDSHDGQFSIHYNPTTALTGSISADGVITGQGMYSSGRGNSSQYTVAGKITAGVAAITIDTPRCHYDAKLTKAG